MGLREKKEVATTKEMIINLKALCFLQLNQVENFFKKIKTKFNARGRLFKKYLSEYFELTWLRGKPFCKELWNYSNGISRQDNSISQKLFLCNNVVESCNSLIASLLPHGSRVSGDKCFEILLAVNEKYNACLNSKEAERYLINDKNQKITKIMKEREVYYFFKRIIIWSCI